jgi:PAS domain S-box-containing protein
MERPIYIRDKDPMTQGSTLVVGINKKGNISRFNETLEQLTGTSKKDALDVPFASYFSKQIPPEELQKLLRQAQYTPESVDIDTTFQTVTGENVVVSWTGFPVKNETDGRVSQLNLVGTPQKNDTTFETKKKSTSSKKTPTAKKQDLKKSPSTEKKSEGSSKKKIDKTDKINEKQPKTESSELVSNSTKKSTKKLSKSSAKKQTNKKPSPQTKQRKKSKKTDKRNDEQTKKTKPSSSKKKKKKIKIKRRSKKSSTKKPKEKPTQKPVSEEPTLEEPILEEPNNEKEKHGSLSIDEPTTEKQIASSEPFGIKKRFSKISIPKKGISKKHSRPSLKESLFSKAQKQSQSSERSTRSEPKNEQAFQKTIKNLQEENASLQKQIHTLEKNLQSAELKKQEIKEFFNSTFRFVRDSIGIKKKREEFQSMMQQLNERKKKLETLETDMVLEKKEFKQKIEEFVTWREKLEKLEQEIEKRRQFLTEQEKFLNEQYDKVLSHELMQPASYTQPPENTEEKPSTDEPGILEKDDLFNALTIEAAVLQRGRIKKANKLFAQMLGYSEDELVGKHLVDFVGPNGLAGVEQHYMNRLKGVDDSSYKTVFLSKNEDEVAVKVHVKTSDFQGERAEIATFNEV